MSAAQRVRPREGEKLAFGRIRGTFGFSGSIGGMGIPAVEWSEGGNRFWAALHDFEPAAWHRMLDMAREIDVAQLGRAE